MEIRAQRSLELSPPEPQSNALSSCVCSLSEQDLGSNPTERINALCELNRTLARELASAVAAPSPDQNRVEELERQLRNVDEVGKRLRSYVSALPDQLLRQREQVCRDERVRVIQENVYEFSVLAGIEHGRVLGSARLEALRAARTEYLKRHEAFFEKYPQVKPAVLQAIERSEDAGKQVRLAAERSACQIFSTKKFDETAAILGTLGPHALPAVRRAFEERYDTPLDEFLFQRFGRNCFVKLLDWIFRREGGWSFKTEIAPRMKQREVRLLRLAALLEGNKVAAAAADLFEVSRKGAGKGLLRRLERTLRGKGEEQCGQIERCHDEYAKKAGMAPLHETACMLPGDEARTYALALLDADTAASDAIYLHRAVPKASQAESVYALLRSKSPEEIKALGAAFDRQFRRDVSGYHRGFKDYVSFFMPLQPIKKAVIALLEGDMLGADVHRIEEGFWTNQGRLIIEPFIGKDREYRRTLLERYRRVVGRPLLQRLSKSRISEVDLRIIRTAVAKGVYDEPALLRHELERGCPDPAALCDLLEGKSKKQIKKLEKRCEIDFPVLHRSFLQRLSAAQEYCGERVIQYIKSGRRWAGGYRLALHALGLGYLLIYSDDNEAPPAADEERHAGYSLVKDLRVSLSGDGEFDVMQLYHGRPENAREVLQLLRSRFRHECSGFLPRIVSLITADGRVMRKDFKQIEAAIMQTAPDPQIFQRLGGLAKIFRVDCERFRVLKNQAGDLAATCGAGAALVTCGLFFGSTPTMPWLAEASLSLGITMATRTFIALHGKGASFDRKEIFYAFLNSMVDGMTFRMGWVFKQLGLQKALMKRATKMVTKVGFKQLISFERKRERVKEETPIARMDRELNPEVLKDMLAEVALAALRGR